MATYELKYTAEEIDGILESVDEKTIYGDATQSEHGLMSVEDKTKLDGLPDGEELSEALDSKIEKRVPTTAGNLAKLTGEGNIADSGYRIDDFATEQQGRLADTAYQKPSSGIPKTDLASSVQTSLGKADTALQEHQDISGKQDTLVSGTNIKTVNGESLLGSGNIEIQGGGGGGEENVIEAITMNDASVPVTNKTAAITETDPTVPSWAKQPNKPSYNYSEISNTPDLSGFITKSVNDLTNYYLKSETYTKAEVAALIGAIQQFHYEIYATLPQSGESNVLYLVGPTGSGSDRYEEYVYSNNTFTKIGDTSIDLSGYVTTSALNTALAGYTPTSQLATVATSGSYNDLSDRPTIPTVPVQDVTVGGTSVVSSGTAVIPAIPDTSDFEASENKVSTIAGNETNTTKYPNTKAVADALGKWGVVSQKISWTKQSDGAFTSTISDVQYGYIPNIFIELCTSIQYPPTFNETTGYFEFNGLTNISYKEMRMIYYFHDYLAYYTSGDMFAYTPYPTQGTSYSDSYLRTLYPSPHNAKNPTSSSFRALRAIEVLKINYSAYVNIANSANISYMFYNACNCLREIRPTLQCGANTTFGSSSFSDCVSLEKVFIKNLHSNIWFSGCSRLSLESIVFMVQNATNTSAITITLHTNTLARCTADTTEYEYNDNTYSGIVALATAKNITLAST